MLKIIAHYALVKAQLCYFLASAIFFVPFLLSLPLSFYCPFLFTSYCPFLFTSYYPFLFPSTVPSSSLPTVPSSSLPTIPSSSLPTVPSLSFHAIRIKLRAEMKYQDEKEQIRMTSAARCVLHIPFIRFALFFFFHAKYILQCQSLCCGCGTASGFKLILQPKWPPPTLPFPGGYHLHA